MSVSVLRSAGPRQALNAPRRPPGGGCGRQPMSAHSRDKVDLAVDIATQHFGVLPGQIVLHLLNHGFCTLKDIVTACKAEQKSSTKFDPQRVRRALLVLLHHGAVLFNQAAPATYFTNPDLIILRLRHASCIQMAKALYGEGGYVITKFLLRHGRLPENVLLDMLMVDPASPYSQTPEEKKNKKREVLRQTVREMTKYHYIETVPKVPLRDTVAAEQAAARAAEAERQETRKRKAKMPDEKEGGGKRFKPAMNTTEGDGNDDGWAVLQNAEPYKLHDQANKGGDTTAAAGEPTGDLYASMMNELDDRSVLRVNIVKYIHRARNDAVIDVVNRLLNPAAADTVRALLTAPERVTYVPLDPVHAVPTFPATSARCPMHDVTMYLRSINPDLCLKVPDIIEGLQHPASSGVLAGETLVKSLGSSTYTVCVEKLATVVKATQIDYVLEKKHGLLGRRIYKILLDKGTLEGGEIQRLSLMPEHEVNRTLYQMKMNGFLGVREVPLTQDMNPDKTFFLWHIVKGRVERRVVEEMYKTLRNLYQRRMHEAKEIAPLLRRSQQLSKKEAEMVEGWGAAQESLGFSVTSMYDLICVLEFY